MVLRAEPEMLAVVGPGELTLAALAALNLAAVAVEPLRAAMAALPAEAPLGQAATAKLALIQMVIMVRAVVVPLGIVQRLDSWDLGRRVGPVVRGRMERLEALEGCKRGC